MSRFREVSSERHGENFVEKATNDLMGVSGSNRGYWEVTVEDTTTGNTATGTGDTKGEAYQDAVNKLS